MAQINYAEKSISCKVVYYGPGVSGKTTNLQIIYEKTPGNNKGNMVSLKTEGDRTLYFDFLPLDLGQIKGFTTKFQLYTVPGQIYYNATRKLVLKGVDAIVFVADSSKKKQEENIESLENLVENLKELNLSVSKDIPLVIQYNKRDIPDALPVDQLRKELNKWDVPDFEAVAVESIGVFKTLKSVAKLFIQGFHEKYGFEVDYDEEAATPEPEPEKKEAVDTIELDGIETNSIDIDPTQESLPDTSDTIDIEVTSYDNDSSSEEIPTEEIKIESNFVTSSDNNTDNIDDTVDITINDSSNEEVADVVSNDLEIDIDLQSTEEITDVSDDIDIDIDLEPTVPDEKSDDTVESKSEDTEELGVDLEGDIMKTKLELESKKNAEVPKKVKSIKAKTTATPIVAGNKKKTFVKRKKKKTLIAKVSSFFKGN